MRPDERLIRGQINYGSGRTFIDRLRQRRVRPRTKRQATKKPPRWRATSLICRSELSTAREPLRSADGLLTSSIWLASKRICARANSAATPSSAPPKAQLWIVNERNAVGAVAFQTALQIELDEDALHLARRQSRDTDQLVDRRSAPGRAATTTISCGSRRRRLFVQVQSWRVVGLQWRRGRGEILRPWPLREGESVGGGEKIEFVDQRLALRVTPSSKRMLRGGAPAFSASARSRPPALRKASRPDGEDHWFPPRAGSSGEPGTAKTSRPCSLAKRAVISEPDRRAASTTTVARLRPEMMRLRRGKSRPRGSHSIGISETTSAAFGDFLDEPRMFGGIWPSVAAGEHRDRSGFERGAMRDGVDRRARVRKRRHSSRSARLRAIRSAKARPAAEALREPTIATPSR